VKYKELTEVVVGKHDGRKVTPSMLNFHFEWLLLPFALAKIRVKGISEDRFDGVIAKIVPTNRQECSLAIEK